MFLIMKKAGRSKARNDCLHNSAVPEYIINSFSAGWQSLQFQMQLCRCYLCILLVDFTIHGGLLWDLADTSTHKVQDLLLMKHLMDTKQQINDNKKTCTNTEKKP